MACLITIVVIVVCTTQQVGHTFWTGLIGLKQQVLTCSTLCIVVVTLCSENVFFNAIILAANVYSMSVLMTTLVDKVIIKIKLVTQAITMRLANKDHMVKISS